jgi:predicted Fe-Mo cluster-binding NifX family protein
MEICITAVSNNIDGAIDGRFGRCKYFIFIDPVTMKYEAVLNPATNESGGAGIKAATMALKFGPSAVITGLIGDNALKVLQASNTRVFSCEKMSVRDAVNLYSSGNLKGVDAPNNL